MVPFEASPYTPVKMRTPSNTVRVTLAVVLSLALQFCGTSRKATITDAPVRTFENPVTYAQHIQPVMVQKCSPCHFPERGRKKMLDTYEATRDNIDDILFRVQLPPEHGKFMPYESKKEPFTAQEIKTFQDWVAQGTPR